MDRFSPWTPELPATLELTLYRSNMADAYAGRKGIERINARTLCTQIDSLQDVGIFLGSDELLAKPSGFARQLSEKCYWLSVVKFLLRKGYNK